MKPECVDFYSINYHPLFGCLSTHQSRLPIKGKAGRSACCAE
jgi:hypothetical protein